MAFDRGSGEGTEARENRRHRMHRRSTNEYALFRGSHDITSASDDPRTDGFPRLPGLAMERQSHVDFDIRRDNVAEGDMFTLRACARAAPQSETSLHLVRVRFFFEMCGRIALLNQPAEGHKKRYMRSCGRG